MLPTDMPSDIPKDATGSNGCVHPELGNIVVDRWKFPAPLEKQFLIRCGLLLVLLVAFSYDPYRQGRNFNTLTIFSSTFLLIMAALVQFFRTLFSAMRVIRYRAGRLQPKRYLFILLLLPLIFVVGRALPNPSFSDGAAHSLIKLNRSDEMVAAVAEEIGKLAGPHENAGTTREWELRVVAKAPFAELDLRGVELRVLDDTLLFEFGGPLTLNRWGFAISSVKGKAPSIPPDRFNHRPVSREIVVFEEPAD